MLLVGTQKYNRKANIEAFKLLIANQTLKNDTDFDT